MAEYIFKIEYRKGASHHVPDALSRAPEVESADCETIVRIQESPNKWYNKKHRQVQNIPELFPNWKIWKGKLYSHGPSIFIDIEMEDMDAWELVLPRE